MSLGVTPGARLPSKVTRMRLGLGCTSDCVASTWITSVAPMPKAMAPMPPWVQVWLSPHTSRVPGRLTPCSGPMTWTMTWRSQILSNRVCPGMSFSSRAVVAARTDTPPSFGVADNRSARKERPQRGIPVILSAAKDLMPVAGGDEVLRLRSGRHELLLLLLLAPALLLGLEERGEDLADGALGDVAGDEHHAALAVVALGPGVERRRRMEDMLHAVDHDRLVGVLDVQDTLHAQEVGPAIGHQRVERRRHRRPAHRLVEGHAEGFYAIVVAVDVVRILLAMAMIVLVLMAMSMVVPVVVMAVALIVAALVGFLVQPALHVGGLGVGIVQAGVEDGVGIDLA